MRPNQYGITGVKRHGNRYHVRIMFNGIRKCIGIFDDLADAGQAYAAAAEQFRKKPLSSEERRLRANANSRSYYHHNKEKHAAAVKSWKSRNREHFNITRKAWRKNMSPEKQAIEKEQHRLWLSQNSEKVRIATKAYYARKPWVLLLTFAKRRAKKRNLPFNLTHAWAAERWTGYCEISGLPFAVPNGRQGNPFAATIDRIKPELGYTIGNCRFVIFAVNAMKGIGTADDIHKIAIAIVKHKGD